MPSAIHFSVAILLLAIGSAAPAHGEATSAVRQRPNVILIVTDDQGYGDFGSTGNPVIETPNLDAMAARSARMSTFYVSPVCAPTRASLMTGRYNYRTGVVDTYRGRAMMWPEEVTLAELLSTAGYATGIFGKWHLGDNYPLRAMDQGFAESLVHRGGGLAQPSDPPENQGRYTNPILFHNGRRVETKGYCTDVYFDVASKFIENAHDSGRNFFAYIATNAPHAPYDDVPAELLEKYRRKDLASLLVAPLTGERRASETEKLARIAAMITNIDDNMGRLFKKLDELNLLEQTLVLFMIDNGPGSPRFVSNLRGMKASVYEGGVRSPLWLEWPGRLPPGRVCDEPSAHIDVMPTILEACDVKPPPGVVLDGRSLLPLLERRGIEWPARNIVIQSHRGDVPVRYHNFMIRDARWKLLHASGFERESNDAKLNFELFDLQNDPGEKENLAETNPEIVARLKASYDTWFEDVTAAHAPDFEPPRIQVGTTHENPSVLTRQDWRDGTWERDSVGHWNLDVANAGTYSLTLLYDENSSTETAKLNISSNELRQAVAANSKSCVFSDVKLKPGDAQLQATLEAAGKSRGVYQVVVTRTE